MLSHGVEKIVIANYKDQLPMNEEFPADATNNGKFYHYDPDYGASRV